METLFNDKNILINYNIDIGREIMQMIEVSLKKKVKL